MKSNLRTIMCIMAALMLAIVPVVVISEIGGSEGSPGEASSAAPEYPSYATVTDGMSDMLNEFGPIIADFITTTGFFDEEDLADIYAMIIPFISDGIELSDVTSLFLAYLENAITEYPAEDATIDGTQVIEAGDVFVIGGGCTYTFLNDGKLVFEEGSTLVFSSAAFKIVGETATIEMKAGSSIAMGPAAAVVDEDSIIVIEGGFESTYGPEETEKAGIAAFRQTVEFGAMTIDGDLHIENYYETAYVEMIVAETPIFDSAYVELSASSIEHNGFSMELDTLHLQIGAEDGGYQFIGELKMNCPEYDKETPANYIDIDSDVQITVKDGGDDVLVNLDTQKLSFCVTNGDDIFAFDGYGVVRMTYDVSSASLITNDLAVNSLLVSYQDDAGNMINVSTDAGKISKLSLAYDLTDEPTVSEFKLDASLDEQSMSFAIGGIVAYDFSVKGVDLDIDGSDVLFTIDSIDESFSVQIGSGVVDVEKIEGFSFSATDGIVTNYSIDLAEFEITMGYLPGETIVRCAIDDFETDGISATGKYFLRIGDTLVATVEFDDLSVVVDDGMTVFTADLFDAEIEYQDGIVFDFEAEKDGEAAAEFNVSGLTLELETGEYTLVNVPLYALDVDMGVKATFTNVIVNNLRISATEVSGNVFIPFSEGNGVDAPGMDATFNKCILELGDYELEGMPAVAMCTFGAEPALVFLPAPGFTAIGVPEGYTGVNVYAVNEEKNVGVADLPVEDGNYVFFVTVDLEELFFKIIEEIYGVDAQDDTISGTKTIKAGEEYAIGDGCTFTFEKDSELVFEAGSVLKFNPLFTIEGDFASIVLEQGSFVKFGPTYFIVPTDMAISVVNGMFSDIDLEFTENGFTLTEEIALDTVRINDMCIDAKNCKNETTVAMTFGDLEQLLTDGPEGIDLTVSCALGFNVMDMDDDLDIENFHFVSTYEDGEFDVDYGFTVDGIIRINTEPDADLLVFDDFSVHFQGGEIAKDEELLDGALVEFDGKVTFGKQTFDITKGAFEVLTDFQGGTFSVLLAGAIGDLESVFVAGDSTVSISLKGEEEAVAAQGTITISFEISEDGIGFGDIEVDLDVVEATVIVTDENTKTTFSIKEPFTFVVEDDDFALEADNAEVAVEAVGDYEFELASASVTGLYVEVDDGVLKFWLDTFHCDSFFAFVVDIPAPVDNELVGHNLSYIDGEFKLTSLKAVTITPIGTATITVEETTYDADGFSSTGTFVFTDDEGVLVDAEGTILIDEDGFSIEGSITIGDIKADSLSISGFEITDDGVSADAVTITCTEPFAANVNMKDVDIDVDGITIASFNATAGGFSIASDEPVVITKDEIDIEVTATITYTSEELSFTATGSLAVSYEEEDFSLSFNANVATLTAKYNEFGIDAEFVLGEKGFINFGYADGAFTVDIEDANINKLDAEFASEEASFKLVTKEGVINDFEFTYAIGVGITEFSIDTGIVSQSVSFSINDVDAEVAAIAGGSLIVGLDEETLKECMTLEFDSMTVADVDSELFTISGATIEGFVLTVDLDDDSVTYMKFDKLTATSFSVKSFDYFSFNVTDFEYIGEDNTVSGTATLKGGDCEISIFADDLTILIDEGAVVFTADAFRAEVEYEDKDLAYFDAKGDLEDKAEFAVSGISLDLISGTFEMCNIPALDTVSACDDVEVTFVGKMVVNNVIAPGAILSGAVGVPFVAGNTVKALIDAPSLYFNVTMGDAIFVFGEYETEGAIAVAEFDFSKGVATYLPGPYMKIVACPDVLGPVHYEVEDGYGIPASTEGTYVVYETLDLQSIIDDTMYAIFGVDAHDDEIDGTEIIEAGEEYAIGDGCTFTFKNDGCLIFQEGSLLKFNPLFTILGDATIVMQAGSSLKIGPAVYTFEEDATVEITGGMISNVIFVVTENGFRFDAHQATEEVTIGGLTLSDYDYTLYCEVDMSKPYPVSAEEIFAGELDGTLGDATFTDFKFAFGDVKTEVKDAMMGVQLDGEFYCNGFTFDVTNAEFIITEEYELGGFTYGLAGGYDKITVMYTADADTFVRFDSLNGVDEGFEMSFALTEDGIILSDLNVELNISDASFVIRDGDLVASSTISAEEGYGLTFSLKDGVATLTTGLIEFLDLSIGEEQIALESVDGLEVTVSGAAITVDIDKAVANASTEYGDLTMTFMNISYEDGVFGIGSIIVGIVSPDGTVTTITGTITSLTPSTIVSNGTFTIYTDNVFEMHAEGSLTVTNEGFTIMGTITADDFNGFELTAKEFSIEEDGIYVTSADLSYDYPFELDLHTEKVLIMGTTLQFDDLDLTIGGEESPIVDIENASISAGGLFSVEKCIVVVDGVEYFLSAQNLLVMFDGDCVNVTAGMFSFSRGDVEDPDFLFSMIGAQMCFSVNTSSIWSILDEGALSLDLIEGTYMFKNIPFIADVDVHAGVTAMFYDSMVFRLYGEEDSKISGNVIIPFMNGNGINYAGKVINMSDAVVMPLNIELGGIACADVDFDEKTITYYTASPLIPIAEFPEGTQGIVPYELNEDGTATALDSANDNYKVWLQIPIPDIDEIIQEIWDFYTKPIGATGDKIVGTKTVAEGTYLMGDGKVYDFSNDGTLVIGSGATIRFGPSFDIKGDVATIVLEEGSMIQLGEKGIIPVPKDITVTIVGGFLADLQVDPMHAPIELSHTISFNTIDINGVTIVGGEKYFLKIDATIDGSLGAGAQAGINAIKAKISIDTSVAPYVEDLKASLEVTYDPAKKSGYELTVTGYVSTVLVNGGLDNKKLSLIGSVSVSIEDLDADIEEILMNMDLEDMFTFQYRDDGVYMLGSLSVSFDENFTPILSVGLFSSLDGGEVSYTIGDYEFTFTFVELKEKVSFDVQAGAIDNFSYLASIDGACFSLKGPDFGTEVFEISKGELKYLEDGTYKLTIGQAAYARIDAGLSHMDISGVKDLEIIIGEEGIISLKFAEAYAGIGNDDMSVELTIKGADMSAGSIVIEEATGIADLGEYGTYTISTTSFVFSLEDFSFSTSFKAVRGDVIVGINAIGIKPSYDSVSGTSIVAYVQSTENSVLYAENFTVSVDELLKGLSIQADNLSFGIDGDGMMMFDATQADFTVIPDTVPALYLESGSYNMADIVVSGIIADEGVTVTGNAKVPFALDPRQITAGGVDVVIDSSVLEFYGKLIPGVPALADITFGQDASIVFDVIDGFYIVPVPIGAETAPYTINEDGTATADSVKGFYVLYSKIDTAPAMDVIKDLIFGVDAIGDDVISEVRTFSAGEEYALGDGYTYTFGFGGELVFEAGSMLKISPDFTIEGDVAKITMEAGSIIWFAHKEYVVDEDVTLVFMNGIKTALDMNLKDGKLSIKEKMNFGSVIVDDVYMKGAVDGKDALEISLVADFGGIIAAIMDGKTIQEMITSDFLYEVTANLRISEFESLSGVSYKDLDMQVWYGVETQSDAIPLWYRADLKVNDLNGTIRGYTFENVFIEGSFVAGIAVEEEVADPIYLPYVEGYMKLSGKVTHHDNSIEADDLYVKSEFRYNYDNGVKTVAIRSEYSAGSAFVSLKVGETTVGYTLKESSVNEELILSADDYSVLSYNVTSEAGVASFALANSGENILILSGIEGFNFTCSKEGFELKVAKVGDGIYVSKNWEITQVENLAVSANSEGYSIAIGKGSFSVDISGLYCKASVEEFYYDGTDIEAGYISGELNGALGSAEFSLTNASVEFVEVPLVGVKVLVVEADEMSFEVTASGNTISLDGTKDGDLKASMAVDTDGKFLWLNTGVFSLINVPVVNTLYVDSAKVSFYNVAARALVAGDEAVLNGNVFVPMIDGNYVLTKDVDMKFTTPLLPPQYGSLRGIAAAEFLFGLETEVRYMAAPGLIIVPYEKITGSPYAPYTTNDLGFYTPVSLSDAQGRLYTVYMEIDYASIIEALFYALIDIGAESDTIVGTKVITDEYAIGDRCVYTFEDDGKLVFEAGSVLKVNPFFTFVGDATLEFKAGSMIQVGTLIYVVEEDTTIEFTNGFYCDASLTQEDRVFTLNVTAIFDTIKSDGFEIVAGVNDMPFSLTASVSKEKPVDVKIDANLESFKLTDLGIEMSDMHYSFAFIIDPSAEYFISGSSTGTMTVSGVIDDIGLMGPIEFNAKVSTLDVIALKQMMTTEGVTAYEMTITSDVAVNQAAVSYMGNSVSVKDARALVTAEYADGKVSFTAITSAAEATIHGDYYGYKIDATIFGDDMIPATVSTCELVVDVREFGLESFKGSTFLYNALFNYDDGFVTIENGEMKDVAVIYDVLAGSIKVVLGENGTIKGTMKVGDSYYALNVEKFTAVLYNDRVTLNAVFDVVVNNEKYEMVFTDTVVDLSNPGVVEISAVEFTIEHFIGTELDGWFYATDAEFEYDGPLECFFLESGEYSISNATITALVVRDTVDSVLLEDVKVEHFTYIGADEKVSGNIFVDFYGDSTVFYRDDIDAFFEEAEFVGPVTRDVAVAYAEITLGANPSMVFKPYDNYEFAPYQLGSDYVPYVVNADGTVTPEALTGAFKVWMLAPKHDVTYIDETQTAHVKTARVGETITFDVTVPEGKTHYGWSDGFYTTIGIEYEVQDYDTVITPVFVPSVQPEPQVIDDKVVVDSDTSAIDVSKETMDAIKDKVESGEATSAVMNVEGASFEFDSDALASDAFADGVTLNVSEPNAKIIEILNALVDLQNKGTAFNFDAMSNGVAIHEFDGKIYATVEYELKEGQNPAKLKAYWYDPDNEEIIPIDFTKKVEGDKVIVTMVLEHFSTFLIVEDPDAELYSVTYYLGDEVYEIQEYYDTEEVTVIPKGVKEGYTVSDWTTTDVEVVDGKFIMPASNVSFYAELTPNEYFVTYLLDGQPYGNAETAAFGSEVTVRAKAVKEGYTVSDWTSDDVTIVDGMFTMPAKDVVITATSTVNQYTVTYKLDGQIYGNVDTVAFGTEVTVRDKPVKTGFVVSDWTSTDVTIVNGKFTMPAKDVVITATSTAGFKVTYKLDGEVYAEQIHTAGEVVNVLDKPTKEGYKVSDWTSTDVTIVDGKFTMPSKDVTITATSSPASSDDSNYLAVIVAVVVLIIAGSFFVVFRKK